MSSTNLVNLLKLGRVLVCQPVSSREFVYAVPFHTTCNYAQWYDAVRCGHHRFGSDNPGAVGTYASLLDGNESYVVSALKQYAHLKDWREATDIEAQWLRESK